LFESFKGNDNQLLFST